VSTLVGAGIGSLPVGLESGAGIVAVLSLLTSLFAGLFGPASQNLGELVSQHAPWAHLVNPTRQVYDALFSLYCYDSYDRWGQILAQLAVLGAVLLAAVLLLNRRRSHVHL
jgi:ABC-2 type transport system permease protein